MGAVRPRGAGESAKAQQPAANRRAGASWQDLLQPQFGDAVDLASAVAELGRRVVASAGLERRRDLVLALALDREDEGEAEAPAIGVVELGEPGEFVGASACRARRSPARASNSVVNCLASASLPARSGWASISLRLASSLPRAIAAAIALARPSARVGFARRGPRHRRPRRPSANVRRCRRSVRRTMCGVSLEGFQPPAGACLAIQWRAMSRRVANQTFSWPSA